MKRTTGFAKTVELVYFIEVSFNIKLSTSTWKLHRTFTTANVLRQFASSIFHCMMHFSLNFTLFAVPSCKTTIQLFVCRFLTEDSHSKKSRKHNVETSDTDLVIVGFEWIFSAEGFTVNTRNFMSKHSHMFAALSSLESNHELFPSAPQHPPQRTFSRETCPEYWVAARTRPTRESAPWGKPPETRRLFLLFCICHKRHDFTFSQCLCWCEGNMDTSVDAIDVKIVQNHLYLSSRSIWQ